MFRKILVLVIATLLLLSSIPVVAADQPIIYQSTMTVTADGGRYDIGFATVDFKKNFLEQSKLPITFNVEIYAENGVAYIEFVPEVPEFLKDVHIRADNYKGSLYDKAKGKNIQVSIKKEQIIAKHFSRYAF